MYGIGIDVSQATLDVAVHEQALRQFSNDKRGFVRLIQWLKQWPIRQVVLEASGGCERAALDALHEAGLPMVRINPARAPRFAQGTGRAAKTDRLDAAVLAQMAHLLPLTPYVPPSSGADARQRDAALTAADRFSPDHDQAAPSCPAI